MTAAARRLHLSQPTLSRQIKALEEHLGAPLFERVGKFIRLSSLGECMLGQCREILALTQNLHGSVQDLTSGQIGMLKVGASRVP